MPQLRIIKREDANSIDAEQWDELSLNSRYPNLFYERWNLLPALEHICKEHLVFVVTLVEDNKLTCLFPIRVSYYKRKIKFITMWKHPHCSLTNPLVATSTPLEDTFRLVADKFKASWFETSCHTPSLFNSPQGIRHHNVSRAGIFSGAEAKVHLVKLPGKLRRENERIVRRLNDNFDIFHNYHSDIDEGLKRYSELEDKGWKGKSGTSMLKSQGVFSYYREMLKLANPKENIVFHELWGGDKLLAITMRLSSRGELYDIKTTYDEKFKSFSPGVAIELLNITVLDDNFSVLDSCTSPNNKLINTLWPHQRQLSKSLIFSNRIMGRFWYYAHVARGKLKIFISKFRDLE